MIQPNQFRVLCIEDNAILSRMLKDVLGGEGYAVETATDGEKALAEIAKNPQRFHLLITDGKTPRFDGRRLIADARAANFGGKIIVFSGCFTPKDQEELRKSQVDALLDKPGSVQELLGVVRAIHAATD
jgi:DNA-binding response OmpR family regulator